MNQSTEKNAPYMYFGHRLWRLREKRGVRTAQMCEYLGISAVEYKKMEFGESLPDKRMIIEIARILKVEVGQIVRWHAYARNKLEDKPLSGAIPYMTLLDSAIEQVKVNFAARMNHEHELDPDTIKTLTNFKKDVCRIFFVPVLPMNLLLILYALDEQAAETKYLHQIADFVAEKESFAGYIARDMYLGPFIYFTANLFFFRQSPCKDIMDCFNRLTVEQFKELLFIAIEKNGVFDAEGDLPVLQQYAEFGSLGALMVRELEKILPKLVNYNQLTTAVLAQGIGIFIIHAYLKSAPTYESPEDCIVDDRPGAIPLNQELNDMIVYELHPVVSAMVASNWDCPREVLDVLVSHHDQPTDKVSPLCAILKIINYFVGNDFPEISRESLDALLKQYPQITLPVESLFQVFTKLQNMKERLIERSSSIVEEVSKKAAVYSSTIIKKSRPRPELAGSATVYRLPPKRSDFRFDPGYQGALLHETYLKLDDFKRKMLSPKKLESLADFEKRMGTLFFRLTYTTHHKDLSALAETLKISVSEIQLRLEDNI